MKRAIIVDIDGTLTSDFGGVPNKPIIDLVSRYAIDHDILILTKRKPNESEYTEKFLKDYNVNYTKIFYTDNKVKTYKDVIKDKWNVIFCLEDNGEQVKRFRAEGITCFQVGETLKFPGRPEPKELRRRVQISFALEPIDDKPGLTNRFEDFNELTKLKFFLMASINVGQAFEELAIRLEGYTGPYYDLCLKAQQDSILNRGGYKVNYGGIISLFPIIISQYYNIGASIKEILKLVPDTLVKATTSEDCVYLQEMRNFAYGLDENAKVHIRPIDDTYKNIYDYYLTEKATPDSLRKLYGENKNGLYHDGKVQKVRFRTGISDNEITNGFPVLREMWDRAVIKMDEGMEPTGAVTQVWKDMVAEDSHNHLKHPVWLADLSTCLYYLILTDRDEIKL
jgi:hypothetical protein